MFSKVFCLVFVKIITICIVLWEGFRLKNMGSTVLSFSLFTLAFLALAVCLKERKKRKKPNKDHQREPQITSSVLLIVHVVTRTFLC